MLVPGWALVSVTHLFMDTVCRLIWKVGSEKMVGLSLVMYPEYLWDVFSAQLFGSPNLIESHSPSHFHRNKTFLSTLAVFRPLKYKAFYNLFYGARNTNNT